MWTCARSHGTNSPSYRMVFVGVNCIVRLLNSRHGVSGGNECSGVSHERELVLDALRLEGEHLAIGVGLRALK